jgi:2-(1,2-epoxy-1,2-dihydrophenyl)acetyl-CoA isomerase
MAANFTTIRVSADAGVLKITLDRPDALNALNEQMALELAAALRMAERDRQLRCVVLAGAGRAFCAGQDLRVIHEHHTAGDEPRAVDFGTLLRQKYNPVISRIRTLEKPVVAAVNGVAAGAGASLAFACDLRVCAKSAAFKLGFVNVGLVPDMGATLMLLRCVGHARATELCFLGEKLPADEARACGLVSRVVDDEHFEAAVGEIAARLAALPTRALGLTKRALNRAWTAQLDDQLEYEAFLQDTAGRTADHREGVAAFIEKRAPKFEGK